ncbi:ubiquitin-like-specific protease 1 [Tasmannia lanceolata]|uniref:ubiquitin-like-specific protease 1 n=1 Tax=Tasmannia lanceolata TaxID=3420 RepID=UPI004062B9E7
MSQEAVGDDQLGAIAPAVEVKSLSDGNGENPPVAREPVARRIRSDIVMENDDVHLLAEDLQYLWNVREYLSGTIVDIYGKHVQFSNEDGLADPRGRIVFVPSVVHGTLTAVGSEVTDKQRIEKWKTATLYTVEAVKMVLLPLCEDSHWVLLIVDMVSKIFHECNSCKGMEFQERAGLTVALLKEYFKERGCDIDNFQYAQMDNFPQQANGVDCGLFVLKAIEHLCANDPFTFTNCDIPAYRLKL